MSGQTAFDMLARHEKTENRTFEEIEGTSLKVLEKDKAECQKKKEMELTAKKNWHRPTGV